MEEWILAILLVLNIVLLIYIIRELIALNGKIRDFNNEGNKTNRRINRINSKINPVSFSNPIKARKNLYKEYENEKGLYEPVTPSKGLKIKEDK